MICSKNTQFSENCLSLVIIVCFSKIWSQYHSGVFNVEDLRLDYNYQKMTIVQIQIKPHQKDTPEEEYKKNVVQGLSQNPKTLHMKYLYNTEGTKIWSEVLKTSEYYVMKAQEEILKRQSSQILSLMEYEQFALIDIGAGNGEKTMVFLEESIKKGKKMEYIAIDICKSGNLALQNKIEQLDTPVDSTIITSLFDEGLDWVGENRSKPLFYFFIGITIGNFSRSERKQFLTKVYDNMKKDDLFLITFDLKKDPSVIQRAYFNNSQLLQKFILINAKRLNEIAEQKIQPQNFWSHIYYNPLNGTIEGPLISRIDQTIRIDGKQFYIQENEPISIYKSQRFSLKDFKKIMQEIGFEFVKHFQDSQHYGTAAVFKK